MSKHDQLIGLIGGFQLCCVLVVARQGVEN